MTTFAEQATKPAGAMPALGQDSESLAIPNGAAWVFAKAASIPEDLRRVAFAHHSKDFRYYEVLERTLSGQFDFRYLVLRDQATGEYAIQPLFFVKQDLLAGLPRKLASLATPIRKLWPGFLTMTMMMIGCAAGEGQLDHSAPWIVGALQGAIDLYRKKAGASIILFKDFPSTYREQMARLSKHGYQRAPSMPAAILDLNFATFEEYMNSRLSKVFRKNLRRKLRALDDAPPVTMEVRPDATEFVDEIYGLYLQTFRRSEFQFEELNREYFATLGERMPDRVRYFLWRQNGKLIAFNLCVVHEGTLYDLDVGLDYSVALDLHLYFVTWRDIIEWCLKNGIRTYHTGPLNYDPKAHLRLSLAPQDLYARHNSDLINPFFKLAIKYLEPTRHDPVLQRFANAHEMK